MDKTETYIKMSDCEEIQKKWEPTEADFMYNFAAKKVSFIRVNRTTDRRFKNHSIPYNKDRFFWLPRQDQLQEMLEPTGLQSLTWQLHQFSETEYGSRFTWPDQWEQLWLAFVLKEKWNKVWNGEEWI